MVWVNCDEFCIYIHYFAYFVMKLKNSQIRVMCLDKLKWVNIVKYIRMLR